MTSIALLEDFFDSPEFDFLRIGFVLGESDLRLSFGSEPDFLRFAKGLDGVGVAGPSSFCSRAINVSAVAEVRFEGEGLSILTIGLVCVGVDAFSSFGLWLTMDEGVLVVGGVEEVVACCVEVAGL